jgi:hypothetical protein
MNLETESPTQSSAAGAPMPAHALIVLICGLAATWLAAGSLGWIAPPLQKALTWLAFGTVVLIALRDCREKARWLLASAAIVAVLMTASAWAIVNILGVAVLLAALAFVGPAMTSRVAGPAALAATTLAVSRLLIEGTASGWALADTIGRAEGNLAAMLTGRPLVIGASFGGFDFLIVMTALAIAWQRSAPQPTARRAVFAALAIVAAQAAYLVVLAFVHELAALLPPRTHVIASDTSHLGLWIWSNTVHAMLPWHLPLLAMLFQTAVAVIMFRSVVWPAQTEEAAALVTNDITNPKRRDRRIIDNPVAQSGKRTVPAWLRFAPVALLLLAAAAVGIAPVKPDLAGRRIVAYDDGTIDWTTTDPGNVPPGNAPRYGLLPALVSSLGGEFVVSKDLNPSDLRDANALIILPPGTPAKPGAATSEMSPEIRQRIWSFVRSGGGLIVASEPETHVAVGDNAFNTLLEPTSMSLRDDTANSLTERWESNLLAAPHAASATGRPGRGCFSIERATSIRVAWPAAPLLTGRWCWNELGSDPMRGEALAYSPGSRLGDLVLAARQNVGVGSVVVLGDATCLSNDGIPFSYTFCGPLLASMADKGAAPSAWWRQFLALAAAAAAVVLLFYRLDPIGLTAAAITLAVAVTACNHLNDATPQLLPSAAKPTQRPVIYVDGSHLEAMGKDPWRDDGIGQFMRVLTEAGYLPLLAHDLSKERLAGAKMVVSIAPGRQFGTDEIADVKAYVDQGGKFLCLAGSPDAGPSQTLLDVFKLQIAPMPVPPWKNTLETEPLGAMAHDFQVPIDIAQFPTGQTQIMRFHAAWPVTLFDFVSGNTWWPSDVPEPFRPIAGNRAGEGQAFLIGDSQFALQRGLNPRSVEGDPVPQNAIFWRTTLRSWLGPPAK